MMKNWWKNLWKNDENWWKIDRNKIKRGIGKWGFDVSMEMEDPEEKQMMEDASDVFGPMHE